jgi:two-component system KDP operon response regulator KdpE
LLILIASKKNETVENITLTFNACLPSCSIVTTGSGAGSIVMARDRNLDLIIVDLSLLNTDCFEVIKQIRKGSTVPIIALSQAGNEVLSLKAFSAGADMCLNENMSELELVARARALMRGRKVVPNTKKGTSWLKKSNFQE